VSQHGSDQGPRAGIKAVQELEREVCEFGQANEILKKASAYFAQAERARV